MTDEERDIAACLLIEKAERNFEQAQKNADMGYWDLVANRLNVPHVSRCPAMGQRDTPSQQKSVMTLNLNPKLTNGKT